ncbi:hypothetical protein H2248_011193 [Termitomyces sp. 'cryptogamus']|nr:hypothetical protein H2248_011193 [Termitomyces sp. 'cryptogamus']
MPSHKSASVLIRLYYATTPPGEMWKWSAWQERTGLYHGLFPHDDALLPGGWSRDDANSVKSFFETYNSLGSEDDKIHFAIGTGGKLAIPMRHLGRPIWTKFANKGMNLWSIHDAIVQEFERHDCHPIAILKRENALDTPVPIQKVWPISTHHVPTIIDSLARSLFGDDVFIPGTESLTTMMRATLIAFVQPTWDGIRRKVQTLKNRRSENRDKAIKIERGKPTKAAVTRVIRALATWKDSETIFGTHDGLKEIEVLHAQLQDMMESMGARVKKRILLSGSLSSLTPPFSGLNNPSPGPRRVSVDPLKGLATEADVADILSVYSDYFDNDDDDEPVPEAAPSQHKLNQGLLDGDDFGVEFEMLMPPETLARNLGFIRGIPPAFHDKRHRLGINSWDDREAFRAQIQLLPLKLHWHQLAGVHAAVQKLWSHRGDDGDRPIGVLIADEVGLGKTTQAIALLAFFNLAISAQLTNKPMPPILEERRYLGDSDNIAPYPFLIVCPGTLVQQWVNEIKTLLRPFSFDIYVYDGLMSGKDFWAREGPFYKSNHAPYHRIIVASHSIVFKEYNANHVAPKKGARPWEISPPTKNAALENTLFGHDYLVTIVDEAHVVRNAGKQHSAILKLLQKSVVRIPMTATPLHTASKDIASMLRLVGLSYFFTEESFQQEKEDIAAFRRAKKLDDDGEAALAESLAAVKRLQGYGANYFIRRTSRSLDWQGQVLINLPKYVEIVGILKLTEREREALHNRNEYISEMLNTGDTSAYKIMTRAS